MIQPMVVRGIVNIPVLPHGAFSSITPELDGETSARLDLAQDASIS
jgi:hypothetical protein